MSYDLDLLNVVRTKEKYERFREYVKKHNVSTITKSIFDVLGDYWTTYPTHTEVDPDSLRTFFFLVKGKKVKDPALYEAAFDNLKKGVASPVMEDAITKHLIEVDFATRIYEEAAGFVTNSPGKSIANIAPLLEECSRELGGSVLSEECFVEPSLGYVTSMVGSKGLSWRLKEMNVSLGPIRKGDFLILAARPEVGKTTFIASEATHMLGQLADDESVIWINNEEASAKVMMRCIQAYFQATTKELMDNPTLYETRFLAEKGKQLLLIKDDSPYRSATKLNQLFKTFKPGLIIFDQLDKVQGFKNDRDDLRLGGLYQWARDVSKLYCPVIAVSQLDGSAEGVKWPTMDHLRGSKTDKPGEADAIIMIGDERAGTLDRYISVAKNKLLGDKHTLEEHRHGYFPVTIEPSKARYVSKWKT